MLSVCLAAPPDPDPDPDLDPMVVRYVFDSLGSLASAAGMPRGAKQCKVSDKTVTSIRKSLTSEIRSEKPTERTYTTKHVSACDWIDANQFVRRCILKRSQNLRWAKSAHLKFQGNMEEQGHRIIKVLLSLTKTRVQGSAHIDSFQILKLESSKQQSEFIIKINSLNM